MGRFDILRESCDQLAGLDLTPAERDRLINQGHRELCLRARWTRAEIELGPTAEGQTGYPLGDVRDLIDVEVAGKTYVESDRASVREAQNGSGGAAPLQLRADGVFYIGFSADRKRELRIWPAGGDGGSLSIVAVVPPAELDDNNQEPEVPAEFDEAIIDYVESIGRGRLDDDEDARANYSTLFEAAVGRLRVLGTGQGDTGVGQIGVYGVHFD